MKIALVHDFLREYGGAERVVETLHETFPDAPLYVAFTDPKAMGIHWQRFAGWDIRQTWMQYVPFHKRFFSPLRLLAPFCFADLDLSEYDVVISSSNAYFAKSVRVRKGAVHICYCHTPPRSLYGYNTMTDWKKNPVIRFFGNLINHVGRVFDVKAAQKVDYFIANSEEVKRRISKFYRRDATVIYPPVDVPSDKEFAQVKKNVREYYFYISRLAFSKNPHLAVEVCTKLDLPLKIAGTGKLAEKLHEIAGKTIEFLGAVSDEQLQELYAGAKFLLYPVEDEDFGIVPIEAMGYGVPVIAHRSGGPQETIIEGKTGVFFDELTVDGLEKAIQQAEHQTFNADEIHAHAEKFSKTRFQKEVKEFVAAAVK